MFSWLSLVKAWKRLGALATINRLIFSKLPDGGRRNLQKLTGLITTGFFNACSTWQALWQRKSSRQLILGALGLLVLLLSFKLQLNNLDLLTYGQVGLVSLTTTNAQLTEFLLPLIQTLTVLAGLIASFFVIMGGIRYMTSQGQPARLQQAKRTLRNALLGLLLVLVAGSLVAWLNDIQQGSLAGETVSLPAPHMPDETYSADSPSLSKMVDFLEPLVVAIFNPLLDILQYLSQQTPAASQNSVIFKIWLAVLGISNSLLVLVIILLGFRLMAASTLGLKEVSLPQLLPRLALGFLLMNSSLFIIDVLIDISNGLLNVFHQAVGTAALWQHWSLLTEASTANPLSLLLLTVFVILGLGLIVYYIFRLVIIYLGVVLAPLVILLQLLPSARAVMVTAMKTYFYNLFILFLHAIILALGFGLLASLMTAELEHQGLLTLLLGIAVLAVLLKTPRTLAKWCQLDYGFKITRQVRRVVNTGLDNSYNHIRYQYLTNYTEPTVQRQEASDDA